MHKQVNIVRRHHCAERRHRLQPSMTLSLTSLLPVPLEDNDRLAEYPVQNLPQNSRLISPLSSLPQARRRGPGHGQPALPRAPTQRVAPLDHRDQPMQNNLSSAAITNEDWKLLQKFNKKLDSEVMTYCTQYREK
jgi:hypothetical protein